MLFIWIAIVIGGFSLCITASQVAVRHASMLAHGLKLPPFIIGVTLLAIGTDTPEIANSIVSSLAGHGDLNVGDSVGSIVTQIALVLGIAPIIAGKFKIGSRRVLWVNLLTIISLTIGILLVADGYLSRLDAMLLLLIWLAASALSWRYSSSVSEIETVAPTRSKTVHALIVIFGLLLVTTGAGAVVKAIIELSAIFNVPEYLISFFGASIGTSLPELAVNITALRSGQKDLALGDIIGACLIDSSLSIAAGPLLFPVAVTASLAVRGAVVAIIVMILSTIVLSLRREHDIWSGILLLLLYGSAYVALIASR